MLYLDLAEAATDELMAKQREVLGATADKVGKEYLTARRCKWKNCNLLQAIKENS